MSEELVQTNENEIKNFESNKNSENFFKNGLSEREYYKGLIESILFLSNEPLTFNKIAELVNKEVSFIKELISELSKEYVSRKSGLRIQELAGGIRISTAEIYGEELKRIFKSTRKQKLSKAALETLAIIAYKQPITRAEIEAIRGVSVDGVIKELMKINFIKIVGRKESPGAPALFGTTKEFLQYFGLKSIKDLPTLEEIKELKFE